MKEEAPRRYGRSTAVVWNPCPAMHIASVLYLAWKYLLYHRWKTLILTFSVTLIVYVPAGLRVLLDQSAAALTARAKSTPLIVGARGSSLQLVLNSLYFESTPPAPTRYAEADRIQQSGLALAIPLYTRFNVGLHPIVGTTLDYFDFRRIRALQGRTFAMLGECVLGSAVADDLGVDVGGHIVSSPEGVFDIAGVYPLRMSVVGVLSPIGTSDDRAVFVDIKTAWVIEGLAHGHQDLASPEAASRILQRQGNIVVANASVLEYNEITSDNVDRFHFHGDPETFPITAVIAVPPDERSAAILRGRYLGDDERVQIVEPREVIDDLLATVLTVRSYVIAGMVLTGMAALLTMSLVFLLSLRLRWREIETLVKIGGSRGAVVSILTAEILLVLAAGVTLALTLTALTGQFAAAAIRALLR